MVLRSDREIMKRKGSTSTGCAASLLISLGFLFYLLLYQASRTTESENHDGEGWKPRIPGQRPIDCDRSNPRFDLCSLNGPTIMDPTSSTLLVLDPTKPPHSIVQKIRPYPRKWENDVITTSVRELTLATTPTDDTARGSAACGIQHDAPALVFSTGGYTGNLYHDFNDGILPLFITVRTLRHDVVLVPTNCRNWWLTKYRHLLAQLSRHPAVNFDNQTAVHCFPSATVGLINNGDLMIDPSIMPDAETLLDFRAFLNRAYTPHYFQRPEASADRPGLVMILRSSGNGRKISNQEEVVQVAEEAGFKVSRFEPTRTTELREAYELINTSHALFGVHGAALTHLLFLRPGSVFVQVIPLGTDWAAETYYAEPARRIGLKYIGYRIKVEESSLVEMYQRDDIVLRNPRAVVKKGWSNTKNIYLAKQDVKLDLVRIRRYFELAFWKAKRFMAEAG